MEPRIKKLEDTQLDHIKWIAEHDGRINAWWEAQHKWNGETDQQLKELADVLGALRLSFWKLLAVVAATSGSTAGLMKMVGLL